ncbi:MULTISPECIES: BlaI/MecI/CopY family transcriptional regulator [Thermoactinomyces]|jgi:predicted transcriptional regulator|nr:MULTISPECIES: BlaI/MecI/CopY family transcriptional regulator [Thermoactinomyces]MCF6133796.1 BlaI/MecI/CopY family transcriptional regulator [Thermoactinomyces vulgaris]RMB03668.1 putative transcriptional regulator [Thermoactinomyces vulgaris]
MKKEGEETTMMTEEQHKMLSKLFGPLELEVLKIIWQKDWQTVQEVLDQLPAHKHYAYTTIMTVMNRLHQKSVLSRKKKGKRYLYKARYQPEDLIRHFSSHTIQGILDDFGDIAIAQFVDAVGNAPDGLRKLKQLLNELEEGERK